MRWQQYMSACKETTDIFFMVMDVKVTKASVDSAKAGEIPFLSVEDPVLCI